MSLDCFARMESASSVNESKQYFHHARLDATKQEIRLIRLIPPVTGDDTTEINCSLEHYILHDEPANKLRYTALSYTWGEEHPQHLMKINGLSFLVRQNLSEFLSAMVERREFETPLWIDQLCIDQDDKSEKNHQVLLMSEIYSAAEKVLI